MGRRTDVITWLRELHNENANAPAFVVFGSVFIVTSIVALVSMFVCRQRG